MVLRRALLAAFTALAPATPAAAQDYDANPSGRALYALADLRLTAADGERAWLDGGFGKGRFGGDARADTRFRARAVEGDLVWQPQIAWSLSATIAATLQQGQQHAVDLSEAYLTYRHDPIGDVHLGGRLGLLWPPISLEHGGPAWSVTETITPSAINSWVGEEVKVAAAEATVSAPFAGGRLAGTAALFELNDTSGTLLSFRGWALHDEKATAFGLQPLPPRNAFMTHAQAPKTSPVIELDRRPGFYAKLGWRDDTVTLQGFYYDNRGDPQAFDTYLQWGWRTRFGQLAAQVKPDARTTFTAQAMTGSTQMGFRYGGRIWVDTDFRAAFLLGTRAIGAHGSVSGRIEAFGTRGHGSVLAADTSEDGWAATLAGRRAIGDHVTLLAEILHIDSTRAERQRIGLAPTQRQTIGQLSVRATL